jgi:hypothetical protein
MCTLCTKISDGINCITCHMTAEHGFQVWFHCILWSWTALTAMHPVCIPSLGCPMMITPFTHTILNMSNTSDYLFCKYDGQASIISRHPAACHHCLSHHPTHTQHKALSCHLLCCPVLSCHAMLLAASVCPSCINVLLPSTCPLS